MSNSLFDYFLSTKYSTHTKDSVTCIVNGHALFFDECLLFLWFIFSDRLIFGSAWLIFNINCFSFSRIILMRTDLFTFPLCYCDLNGITVLLQHTVTWSVFTGCTTESVTIFRNDTKYYEGVVAKNFSSHCGTRCQTIKVAKSHTLCGTPCVSSCLYTYR